MKFNVGDRIVMNTNMKYHITSPGKTGKIFKYHGGDMYSVDFDGMRKYDVRGEAMDLIKKQEDKHGNLW